MTESEESIAAVIDGNILTINGIANNILDRARENPRVQTLQRPFLAGLQYHFGVVVLSHFV